MPVHVNNCYLATSWGCPDHHGHYLRLNDFGFASCKSNCVFIDNAPEGRVTWERALLAQTVDKGENARVIRSVRCLRIASRRMSRLEKATAAIDS